MAETEIHILALLVELHRATTSISAHVAAIISPAIMAEAPGPRQSHQNIPASLQRAIVALEEVEGQLLRYRQMQLEQKDGPGE